MPKKLFFIIGTLIFIFMLIFFLLYYFNFNRYAKITIIYTSDLEGYIGIGHYEDIWSNKRPKPLYGGPASLATYIRNQRAQIKKNKIFLLLDCGDIFSGNPLGYFSKGHSVIEIMNAISYDAMSIGDRDFAFGKENLRSLSNISKFPFICANMVEKNTGKAPAFIKPYIIKEFPHIKLGIIGIVTPLRSYALEKNIEGLEFLEPLSAVKRYVKILKQKNIDSIVVLSQLGFSQDKKLAQEVEGIDIIIGGHNYELPWQERLLFIEPKNKTIIAKNWIRGLTLFPLELSFDLKSKKIIKFNNKNIELYTSTFKPAIDIENLLRRYKDKIIREKKKIIGYAEISLSRSKDKESSLGNWVADILRQKTKTDIALVAGLEADLKQGEITLGDVYNILPIIDRLDVVGFNLAILELTGEQIKEMLERGVYYGLKEEGEGILQVSGLRYSYDLRKDKWNRITEVTINGQDLETGRTYKVAVNGYLASGLGGYYTIKDAKNRYDTGLMDFDVLVEYIKEHSPITAPPLEGRIIRQE